MRRYESNQQFYDHIAEVAGSLRSVGQQDIADQIDFLLYKVAWNSASELFGELREKFEKALHSPTPLPLAIAADFKDFISTINQALDDT